MPDNKDSKSKTVLSEAIEQLNRGINGDKEAAQKAQKMFQDILSREPDNCLAEAYLGSATALLGRDEVDPTKRISLVLRGLKTMDRAVTKEPENIEIRMTRGSVCLNLPEFYFHRTGTAVEDFSFVASRYEADKKVCSKELYWKVLYSLGLAYKKLDRTAESDVAWQKLWSATEEPNEYRVLLKQEGFKAKNEGSVRSGAGFRKSPAGRRKP